MKKFVGLVVVLVFMFAFGTAVMADPGQNPNCNPVAVTGGVTITVTGGGSNLVILATCNVTSDTQVIPREGSGTFIQYAEVFGYSVRINIQGNSLVYAKSTPLNVPYVPVIVDEYTIYEFVRLNQIESFFQGTSEVEDSREFVNGSVVKYNWERGNHNRFPGMGFTGQAVRTGASVTGTLNYEFVRNYVERFERIYEVVDVVVWSDETRVETVRENSEFVKEVVDGDTYYTGPYAASRAINNAGGAVFLHMGNGQGANTGRTAIIQAGAFSVHVTLHNTGNPPRMTFVILGYDIDAL